MAGKFTRPARAIMLFSLDSGEQPGHVRIASAKLEPEGAPVDKIAFILGGKKATKVEA